MFDVEDFKEGLKAKADFSIVWLGVKYVPQPINRGPLQEQRLFLVGEALPKSFP